ncbi:hypothetical protein [Methanobacterium sp. SMA-27]|uniref:hypothetical protein n=1 Tax=Methanobacterium sp. SMA-27 TaxID=1495336 RepID=UPI0012E000FB|nr:hypothetical protein [Methanobacterium sp. SMA-27]
MPFVLISRHTIVFPVFIAFPPGPLPISSFAQDIRVFLRYSSSNPADATGLIVFF